MMDSPLGRRRRVMADINMIPLIDVTLVLLVIFMVVTPVLVRSQLDVRLPKAEAAKPENPEKNVIHAEIDRSGKVSIENVTVAAGDIEGVFRQRVREGGGQTLVIAADREVAFEVVVNVMDAAKKTGIGSLAVSVRRE